MLKHVEHKCLHLVAIELESDNCLRNICLVTVNINKVTHLGIS